MNSSLKQRLLKKAKYAFLYNSFIFDPDQVEESLRYKQKSQGQKQEDVVTSQVASPNVDRDDTINKSDLGYKGLGSQKTPTHSRQSQLQAQSQIHTQHQNRLQPKSAISQKEKLDVLEEVLDEIEVEKGIQVQGNQRQAQNDVNNFDINNADSTRGKKQNKTTVVKTPDMSKIPKMNDVDQLQPVNQSLSNLPQAIQAQAQAQARMHVGGQAKEAYKPASNQENGPVEMPASSHLESNTASAQELGGSRAGFLESQPTNPEIPVEVEGFMQRVEEEADEEPTEIVLADGSQPSNTELKKKRKKVIVIPIDREIKKKAKWQPVSTSVRWLYEWGMKMYKKFSDQVVFLDS